MTSNLFPTSMLNPLLWLREYSHDFSNITDTRTIVFTFIFAGTAGIALVGAVQSIIGLVVSFVLFGKDAKLYLAEAGKSENDVKDDEHRLMRRRMSRRWRYWIFVFVFAYVMAALLEELLKYFMIIGARAWGRVNTDGDYVFVAIAGALGFAMVEGFGFIFASVQHGERGRELFLTVFERVVGGLSLHSMTAVLVAVGVVLRDERHEEGRGLWRILLEPVVFHGSFDFVLVGISAYNGHIGWVRPRRGPTLYIMFGAVIVTFSILFAVMITKLKEIGLVS